MPWRSQIKGYRVKTKARTENAWDQLEKIPLRQEKNIT